jgi:hypothetical protein
MGKKFGELKPGENIYKIDGLEIIKEKITDAHPFFENPHSVCINKRVVVGKYTENSYNNSVFSNYEKAEEWLIENAKERIKWLEDKIDMEIQEYERLEKFLHDKAIYRCKGG